MLNTAAYKAIKDAVSIDSRKSLFLYAFFISISNIGRIKLTSFIGDKCIALYRDWGQAQKTAYLHRSLRFSEQNNLLDIPRNSPHQGIRPNSHSAAFCIIRFFKIQIFHLIIDTLSFPVFA